MIPTKHGETVCLRILGRESLFLKWDQLGMNAHQESLFSKLVSLPQGLILVTGPTGSGKTTSLYAALAQANDEGRKIVTIEDPVEYEMDGISQIQTRDDIGLTFAGGLRSVLRHGRCGAGGGNSGSRYSTDCRSRRPNRTLGIIHLACQ